MKNKFTEDDKKKLIDFLNFVTKNAEFKVNVNELIEFFKLLSFMQQNLLPKVDAHILEILRVVEAKEPPKESN